MTLYNKYVLDSSALLAFLRGEAGAQTMGSILAEPGAQEFISAVSLGEALRIVRASYGEDVANAVEAKVLETKKLKIVDATWKRVKHSAGLRTADRDLSFTQCFCVGLAQEKQATLVTCDRGLAPLEQEGLVTVLWLPV